MPFRYPRTRRRARRRGFYQHSLVGFVRARVESHSGRNQRQLHSFREFVERRAALDTRPDPNFPEGATFTVGDALPVDGGHLI